MSNLVSQLWLLKQIYSGASDYDSELGCSVHRIPKSVSQEDLAMLKRAGREPNRFVKFEHEKLISELKEQASCWSLEQAAGAFIASLWSAPFMWRTALPGKLLAEAMPVHSYEPFSEGSRDVCGICGFHRNKAVDETLHWYFSMRGESPIDGLPTEHVLVLRNLIKRGDAPTPKTYDLWAFRAVLTVLRQLPAKTRYSKAAEALAKEKLLPIKEIWAYRSLLESLAVIGVLATEERPGMAERFTTYKERDQRPSIRVEVQAPLAWWDSSCGLREDVLSRLFAGFDVSSVDLSAYRPEPVPALDETVTGALQKKKLARSAVPKASATAGKGPVQPGDVYGVRINEDAWVAVYCHEVESLGGRTVVRTEFLKGVYEEMPKEEELQMEFQGRPTGRWQHWTSSIDSTSWVRRITRNVAAPVSEERAPKPDGLMRGGAKDLRFLARHCFEGL